MIAQLRQSLRALQKPAGIDADAGPLPLGIAAIDLALGGGLARGALHEIAAAGEAHITAAAGFALGLAPAGARLVWIAEDMALRRKRCALRARARGLRPSPRAAADGGGRATLRPAVGDGGSAALPRHRGGDRRSAPWRDRPGGGAPALACRRAKRRAGAAAARRAAARRLHRRHALDRRRRALFTLPWIGRVDRRAQRRRSGWGDLRKKFTPTRRANARRPPPFRGR